MKSQTTTDSLDYTEYLKLAAFTLLCFFAFTYNLGEVPPYHSDENFYVTSTRNMVNSGDYLTPVYHDKKRFAKPILFYWLTAASYKAFGTSLFSARLVSAFFGALCIPLVYAIARRLFDRQTAMLSAFLLPGCYLHYQIARWAITDMALNFFILLAIYFFIRGLRDDPDRGTLIYFAYASMGIGFMIKGPPAVLIPALAVGIFTLVLFDRSIFSQLRLASGTVILSVLIVPWFATMFSLHGDEFKNHILGAEFRDRIIHDTPFSLYYLGVTLRYYLPWSLFFIAALVVQFTTAPRTATAASDKNRYLTSLSKALKIRFTELREKDHQSFLFCLAWILGPLLLFTLFRIEHSRYMLPISPAIVMITAHCLACMANSPTGYQKKSFKVPFYLTLIIYFLLAISSGIATSLIQPAFSPPLSLLLLPGILFFGVGCLLLCYRYRKVTALVITISLLQLVTLTSFSGDALPFFNRYPMKAFAAEILADPQPEKRIGLYQLGNHRARMGVLTGLPSIYLNNAEELNQFIQSGEKVFVVMRESDWKEEFSGLHFTLQAIDTGWRKVRLDWNRLHQIHEDGLKLHLPEYTETYVLLALRK
ncbi:MAG: phospholipid carrier-dependent glycosyltransferase [Dehalococcoidales bacterium]|nr:phospholipid carrier-dependent glycosyltransferase [Dehalococcoidales bacterium]